MEGQAVGQTSDSKLQDLALGQSCDTLAVGRI